MPVARARVTLRTETQTLTSETDQTGRARFDGLVRAPRRSVRVEKQGFYATEAEIDGAAVGVALTLYHEQELAETVNVYASSAPLDPEQTAASATLTAREILALPYPATHDVRNALPLLPGVVRDGAGRLHVDGAEAQQTQITLDGFNISHPATGLWQMRVSADAVRAVELWTGRRPVELGRGSAGTIELVTGMGDDRFSYSATNFVPAVQTNKGLHVSNWTPRWTVSGPIRRQRAWFFHAGDGEYVQNVVDELPAGADRARTWRASALARSQLNLGPQNILTASLLVNRLWADRSGLSPLNPLPTTVDQRGAAYLLALKAQHYRTSGLFVEAGFGASDYDDREIPLGDEPYIIAPSGARGNFFRRSRSRARRFETFARLALPLMGRHHLKLGVEADVIDYRRVVVRRPIIALRADGTVARLTTFSTTAPFARRMIELGAFLQDRWAPAPRLTAELGLRLDRDSIFGRLAPSPRVALAYAPNEKTRVALGVGVVRDETNLALISRPQEGERTDIFRLRDGRTTVRTSAFQASDLRRVPWFVEWSAAFERELPAALRLTVETMTRRGRDQPAFIARAASPERTIFELTPSRRDALAKFEIAARRRFKNDRASLFVSYARLRARSNAVLDFDLDSILFGQQRSGPLAWEVPHRLLAWGTMPLGKRFDLACSADWHTGFRYSLVDQEQRLVGPPNAARLPARFSLNAHVEWRFDFLGRRLALRVGVNNLTGRKNPAAIVNNVDAPNFGTPIGTEHRVLTSRIRFLGRKK